MVGDTEAYPALEPEQWKKLFLAPVCKCGVHEGEMLGRDIHTWSLSPGWKEKDPGGHRNNACIMEHSRPEDQLHHRGHWRVPLKPLHGCWSKDGEDFLLMFHRSFLGPPVTLHELEDLNNQRNKFTILTLNPYRKRHTHYSFLCSCQASIRKKNLVYVTIGSEKAAKHLFCEHYIKKNP